MNTSRIASQVLEWDISINGVWATDLYDILLRAGFENHYCNW